MMPKLKAHSFYQLTQGNVSIWSTPWCTAWTEVYNQLVIQQPPFVYPAFVKDLWHTNQKRWNHSLVTQLFLQPIASVILNTPIIQDDGPDILCWDLTPNGKYNSKSSYKLCLQDLQLLPNNQPRQSPQQVKDLLK